MESALYRSLSAFLSLSFYICDLFYLFSDDDDSDDDDDDELFTFPFVLVSDFPLFFPHWLAIVFSPILLSGVFLSRRSFHFVLHFSSASPLSLPPPL